MGKVIKQKIQGMSWLSKTGLVLLLTLTVSVLMGSGMFIPAEADAATYYVVGDTATNLGADGTANLPNAQSTTNATSTTTPTFKGLLSTSAGTATSWRPASTSTGTIVMLNAYSPVYATAVDISNISVTMAVRSANTAYRYTMNLYAYNPAGAANNKTLIATSTSVGVSTTGSTVALSPTYTVSGTGRIPAGYRLMAQIVHTATAASTAERIYYGAAATGTTAVSITLTETPVVTDSTPPTAGTVTVTPDISSTYTSSAPTITTIFTDAQSAVSSCQYTTDGSTWVAGVVSGTGPAYTCTANPTGRTGFLNINMRATSGGGGPTTATQIQRTVDATVPTNGVLTVTKGNTLNSLSWTAATDTGGSGIASYVLRFATGATAPANCTSGTAVPGSPFSSAILSTTHTGLTNGTQYSYRLCATDNLGNSTGGVTGTATPAVGPVSTITSCSGCHGYTTTFNDGTARNVPAGQFQGSHNNHVVAGSLGCAACHTIPATTTSADYPHANGTINMASPINGDAGAAYSKGSFSVTNAAFSGGTCSSTKCHGTTSPAWGNNSAANIDTCTKCHGTKSVSPATDLQKAPTAPATAAHNVHLAGSTIGKLVACGECHENVSTINSAGHMDGIKTIQFNGPIGYGVPASVTPPNTLAGCATSWCHGGNTTLIPQNKPTARTTPVWGTTFGTTSVKGDSLGAASTNTGSGRCARCHGFPPATSSHNGKLLADCITCHPHVNTAGTGFIDPSIHIDGKIDGGGSCTDCHDTTGSGSAGTRLAITPQFGTGYSHHYQGAAAVDGKVCYACHWESDSAGSTTAYHQGSVGAAVDLVVWNATARPATYTANVTATTYLSGGAAASSRTELTKINTHCLGCHNDANKAIAPFSASGDTRTPTAYSWEALAVNVGGLGGVAQSIAAKYSDTATTLWGKFSGNYTNAKNSQTKAFSAHGNAAANQRGWNTTAENAQGAAVANYPNTSGTVQVLCFDCHNSHGSDITAAVATTSYDSATGTKKGGILKQTTAGKGGYAATYKPVNGGATTTKNVYNNGAALCFDCHNNSSANTATSTGFASPWGYTATFGSTQIIHGYNDNPYFGKAGGTFAKGITYPYLAGLTTNRGGHLGASSALTTTPVNNLTIGGLCTPCHDPHGVSPGIATANRQYAVPLLKETFVTSPYKQDAAAVNTTHGGGDKVTGISAAATAGYHIDQNTMQAATTGTPTTALKWNFATSAATLNTLTDTQFAGLCMKCHAKASLNSTAAATSANWKTMTRIHNSVKGWASTGGGNAGNTKHAYTCSKCHSSHNSNLPRLLVTDCLDARHKNRSATAVTPTAATIGPFSGSNGSGNGLGRFPGGGASATNGSRSDNLEGAWFFGTLGTAATQPCHDSATAGGTTFDPAGTSQQWNTKSLW